MNTVEIVSLVALIIGVVMLAHGVHLCYTGMGETHRLLKDLIEAVNQQSADLEAVHKDLSSGGVNPGDSFADS